MKIICFADTHKFHESVKIPDGDVLIFGGDMCGRDGITSVNTFNKWLGQFPHKHKIVIAGNHDRCFENELRFAAREMITNAIYLEDSETIIDGVKFYGSPWQPFFLNWAFNLQRGIPLRQKWDMIPDDVNVLITHGPPQGILDVPQFKNDGVGCEELLDRVQKLPELKCHIFGHVHEGYGVEDKFGITFVNASVCTFAYEPINAPIEINI